MRLRVGLRDGAVVEGTLHSASSSHLSLVLDNARAQLIPASDISSLHIGVRRSGREFLLVTILILGATTVVVAAYFIEWLRPYIPRLAGVLALLGLALIAVLKRRTGLGQWLTSWQTLFDARKD